MASGRVAWWVAPVNGLMTPVAWRERRRPESSFLALQARAARRTGLPEPADPGFVADLRVLYSSFLAVPELSFIGLTGIRAELARHLSNRLRVRELLRAHPEITSAPVSRPVFVVGLPRTGTTWLHALLASAPGHRAPLMWELLAPCPQPDGGAGGPDDRLRNADRMARLAHRAAPSMRVIHPVDARAPEECVFALPHHMAYRNRARIVGYQDWYTRRDATGDYAYLRQQLQILQWKQPRTRWILKSPFHLWHLDALLRVFPDATIVWPHRDVATVLASWCSLSEVIMRLHNRRVDLNQLGPDWTQIWSQAMTRAAGVRATATQPFLDLYYTELARTPLPALEDLFSRLGAELTPAALRQITSRARTAPAGPGAHRYSLDRYGLTPEAIRDAFPDPSRREILDGRSEFASAVKTLCRRGRQIG
ncbi:MAG TPA: sulfotransferase [Trebonia sp.]